MSHITISKVKRLIVSHYTRFLMSLGIVLLCISFTFSEIHVDDSIDTQKIENNIDYAFSQTSSLCEQWLLSNNDSLFISNLWRIETPSQWDDRGISLFLYKSDSLHLWSNYKYRENFDPNSFDIVNSLVSWQDNKILIEKYVRDDKAAIVVLNLYNDEDKYNKAIFGTKNVSIYSPDEVDQVRSREKIYDIGGERFYVEPHEEKAISTILSTLHWIGLVIMFFSIELYFRRHTKRNNTFTVNFIFFGIVILANIITILTNLFPPNDLIIDAVVISSNGIEITIAKILAAFTIVLIYNIYLYKIRHKLIYRYKKLCTFQQYILLIALIAYINIIVVFFHIAMVNAINRTLINVELYKFTLIDHGTILFYFISIYFVVSRILLNVVIRKVFSNRSLITIVVLSVIILTLMILPIQNAISKTGPLLVVFHILFIICTFLEDKYGKYFTFTSVITVFAVYVMLFATIESNEAAVRDANIYAKELAYEDSALNEKVKYKKLTYYIINDHNLEVKEDNSYDLQQLTRIIDQNVDTTVNMNGYTHLVYHALNNKTVVVSRRNISILDYAAFFAYIYVVLFLISTILLRIIGYNYRQNHIRSRFAIRIGMVVIGIVVINMALVIVVITINTFDNYEKTQRQIVNNQMSSLMNSFNQYAQNNRLIDDNDILSSWFYEIADAADKAIFIYRPDGRHLTSTLPLQAYDNMNSAAYSALHWNGAPYFNHLVLFENSTYNSSYVPVFHNGRILGYINLVKLNRVNDISLDPRYDILINVLNILVVVIFIAIILSLLLYRMLTIPLNKLYHGMSNITSFRRIEETEGKDEIATLIRQYNRMIDFLEDSYEALVKSEREGAWREMARQVAHEIKNPLTPMRLRIQMLQRAKSNGDKDIDSKVDSTLEMLLEQIDLLATIASEFSDFARISEGEVELINISKLLESINELYAAKNESLVFEVLPMNEDLTIKAIHSQISRVLINLCQNSIQALAGKEDGYIKVQARKVNKDVIITVEDNGSGINEQIRKRIFEPNFTTKTSGSGLGLAMSRQIIISAGGKITFDSIEGVGTTFYVVLPLYKEKTDTTSDDQIENSNSPSLPIEADF